MNEGQKYMDFETYEREAEPHKREKVSDWRTLLVFRAWRDSVCPII